mmetsp:Transcript_29040/g.56076  ORF Transcript_29040/g.56076 Transcript_29040/m.56076 type:complete len:153 (+) Transcript_29040:88-546(+)
MTMPNIWTAAADGDITRVQELMEIQGLGPTAADESGYTPVHAAAAWGQIALLEQLLARDGHAANVRDLDGDTPLHHVAVSDLGAEVLKGVMQVLFAHGADPDLKNNDQQTCLDVAAKEEQDEIASCNGEEEQPPVATETEFGRILTSCLKNS